MFPQRQQFARRTFRKKYLKCLCEMSSINTWNSSVKTAFIMENTISVYRALKIWCLDKHRKRILKLITPSPRGTPPKLQQLACCLVVLPAEEKVAAIKACWRQHAQTNVHWQKPLPLQLTNCIFKQRLAWGLQGWMLLAPRELLDLSPQRVILPPFSLILYTH